MATTSCFPFAGVRKLEPSRQHHFIARPSDIKNQTKRSKKSDGTSDRQQDSWGSSMFQLRFSRFLQLWPTYAKMALKMATLDDLSVFSSGKLWENGDEIVILHQKPLKFGSSAAIFSGTSCRSLGSVRSISLVSRLKEPTTSTWRG